MREHVRIVAGLLHNPQYPSCVFIQQRAADSKRGGLWEFPGGKQERGEVDEETLARELREELNLHDCHVYRKHGEVFYDGYEVDVNVALYYVTATLVQLKPLVQQKAAGWVPHGAFTTLLYGRCMVPSMELLYNQNPRFFTSRKDEL